MYRHRSSCALNHIERPPQQASKTSGIGMLFLPQPVSDDLGMPTAPEDCYRFCDAADSLAQEHIFKRLVYSYRFSFLAAEPSPPPSTSLVLSEAAVIQANPFPEDTHAASVLHANRVRLSLFPVSMDSNVAYFERFRLTTEDVSLACFGLVHSLFALFGFGSFYFLLWNLPTAMRTLADCPAECVAALLADCNGNITRVNTVDRSVRVNAVSVVQHQAVCLVWV
jgi:hypothetical protein